MTDASSSDKSVKAYRSFTRFSCSEKKRQLGCAACDGEDRQLTWKSDPFHQSGRPSVRSQAHV